MSRMVTTTKIFHTDESSSFGSNGDKWDPVINTKCSLSSQYWETCCEQLTFFHQNIWLCSGQQVLVLHDGSVNFWRAHSPYALLHLISVFIHNYIRDDPVSLDVSEKACKYWGVRKLQQGNRETVFNIFLLYLTEQLTQPKEPRTPDLVETCLGLQQLGSPRPFMAGTSSMALASAVALMPNQDNLLQLGMLRSAADCLQSIGWIAHWARRLSVQGVTAPFKIPLLEVF